MNILLPKFCGGLFLLVALLLPVYQAPAQTGVDMQPGIVISVASLDENFDDIEYLMEKAGGPMAQMAPLVRMGASEFIRGLDTTKPIGSMLFFEEGTPEPKILAFIPITDIDELLDTISEYVDIDEDGDTIVITTDDGTEFTVVNRDGFAFVTDREELLDNLPSNPVSLLEGMQETYNLSAKLFAQRIPKSLRDQGIELIRQGAALEMENLGDSPQAELQRQNFEYSMKQLEQLVNETDEVVAGMSIDKDNSRLFIDVSMQGTPGSKFARQSAALAEKTESKFAGFLVEGAAMNFHMCARITDEDVPEMEKLIDSITAELSREMENEIPDDDQREFVQQIFDDLVDVVKQTFKEGVMDAGGVLNLDEEQANFAIGFRVADPAKLEASCKKIAKIVEDEADVPVQFNFDMSTENGITYHEIVIDVPEDEEEMRDLFGESVKLLIGVGDKAVYLAGGKQPKAALEKSMGVADSGDRPPMQYNLHVAPILRFFAKTQDQEQLSKMADALEPGTDRVRIVASAIENGQTVRIEIQDGLLKLIGIAAQEFGGGLAPRQDF